MSDKKRLSIDEVIESGDVHTFAKEDKKKTHIKEKEEKAEQYDRIKKGLGRPSKSEDEKAKRRVLYWTDEEFEDIERIAKLNGMKALEWVKFVVGKEIRRERGV